MLSRPHLAAFLEESRSSRPDHVAVEEPGYGEITYQELGALSDRLRDRLVDAGISHGDRVGIFLPKSIDSLVSIFGILKTGAAYVPVDPGSPAARSAYILADCDVKAVIVTDEAAESLKSEMMLLDSSPVLFILQGTGGGAPMRRFLEGGDAPVVSEPIRPEPDDLAYILYTSGSTGKPKGVMLTHRAAIAFVDWCSEAFEPQPSDRFSSHAPFHFDLSILDIYVAIKHAATLVLVSEELGKDPLRLAPLIADTGITIWYSTPSILSFLAQFGRMKQYDYSKLHTVLFAGEVFPIKHLRMLMELLPGPSYFNLYGPTETNVCTYHPIPAEIPAGRTTPFPIGKACSHYRIRVLDDLGQDVTAGEEGELCANSPGMMEGYWNLPERTATAFWVDSGGNRWYRTGDIVVDEGEGVYNYIGRRDRMVKKRGYRVELGEIEAGLYKHESVREAAVVALHDEEYGVRTVAFLSCEGDEVPSMLAMKRFSMDVLPAYMVPDLFKFIDVLPKTSTDKIDYQALKTLVS